MEIKLTAQARDEKNGRAKQIRAKGFIPVVLYGSGGENKNLKIRKIDFEKIYDLAGESSLINLEVDKEPAVKVLVKDMQRDPVKDEIIHVDLYRVDMHKKIRTEIPLHFTGEAPAVKELNGILVKNMDEVEVECLPGDLVHQLEVDLSVLKTFDEIIKLHDLKLPAGMELVSETDDIVANVVQPRVEVEEEIKAEEGAEAAAEEKAEVGKEAGGKESGKEEGTDKKEKAGNE